MAGDQRLGNGEMMTLSKICVRNGVVERDIIEDIAELEDRSLSIQLSTCQGLDLPGQASPNKQSESLAKQGASI